MKLFCNFRNLLFDILEYRFGKFIVSVIQPVALFLVQDVFRILRIELRVLFRFLFFFLVFFMPYQVEVILARRPYFKHVMLKILAWRLFALAMRVAPWNNLNLFVENFVSSGCVFPLDCPRLYFRCARWNILFVIPVDLKFVRWLDNFYAMHACDGFHHGVSTRLCRDVKHLCNSERTLAFDVGCWVITETILKNDICSRALNVDVKVSAMISRRLCRVIIFRLVDNDAHALRVILFVHNQFFGMFNIRVGLVQELVHPVVVRNVEHLPHRFFYRRELFIAPQSKARPVNEQVKCSVRIF